MTWSCRPTCASCPRRHWHWPTEPSCQSPPPCADTPGPKWTHTSWSPPRRGSSTFVRSAFLWRSRGRCGARPVGWKGRICARSPVWLLELVVWSPGVLNETNKTTNWFYILFILLLLLFSLLIFIFNIMNYIFKTCFDQRWS